MPAFETKQNPVVHISNAASQTWNTVMQERAVEMSELLLAKSDPTAVNVELILRLECYKLSVKKLWPNITHKDFVVHNPISEPAHSCTT
jgi:hypothetical protein